MALHTASKILSPDKGYPCIYRNWRAKSHCHNWHGYDLRFELYLECATSELTPEGWVVDFGAFRPLKKRLDELFDHKWIIAEDDPLLAITRKYIIDSYGASSECGELVVLDNVSAEAFALLVANETRNFLNSIGRAAVVINQVVARENGANAGGWIP